MPRVALLTVLSLLLVLLVLLVLPACGGEDDAPAASLEIVAESASRRWTGVAVTPDGRIFVNFPRWSDDVDISVAEIIDGKLEPFPDEASNAWTAAKDAGSHHVCVQSVTVDDEGHLWVLDPGNPQWRGVVPGAAKLTRHDLATGSTKCWFFDASIAPDDSYLNDVRVDTKTKTAYLTDSGAGALVVLDLETGRKRRLLDDHPSTNAEPIDITIEGKRWERGGKTPQVHADGIALSPDRRWIYYQALTGRTMYRIPTEALRNEGLDAKALAATVEPIGRSGVSDGLLFDADGNLYLSSLEENAINRFDVQHERHLVVKDPRLSWPDSFARGPDGWIYVTTAMIHRGGDPGEPFRVWRFKP